MLGAAYQNSRLCMDGRTRGCHGSGIENDLLGVDIMEVEDASQVQEWKQFRYDLITIQAIASTYSNVT